MPIHPCPRRRTRLTTIHNADGSLTARFSAFFLPLCEAYLTIDMLVNPDHVLAEVLAVGASVLLIDGIDEACTIPPPESGVFKVEDVRSSSTTVATYARADPSAPDVV